MHDTVIAVVRGQLDLEQAVRSWSAGEWLGWDRTVRDIGRWHTQLLPSRRKLFGTQSGTGPGTVAGLGEVERTAIALCHPNGRIRERALQRPTARTALLPLVAVRCADWADPVRTCARHVLLEAMPACDADALTRLAAPVLRLGKRARGEFGAELLRKAVGHGSIGILLGSPDVRVRREACRWALEERWLDARESARTAVDDPDTVVQRLCADAALRDVTEATADDVLGALLAARNPRARSAGVTALRRLGRAGLAPDFLTDRSALVRACARYVVRQDGHDPHLYYQELCTGEDVTPGAVIGLAECERASDAGTLWRYAGHERAAVRARAVAGLRLLDLAFAERLLPLIDDESPGVVREAVTALLPSAAQLPEEWLMHRVAPGRAARTRRAAFRLLTQKGGLPQLRVAVSLLGDEDVRLRHWAEMSVQRWQADGGVPRGDAEVAALLDRSAHLFDDYVLRRRKWAAGIRA
ncbi:hypothetical protein [Streptomyces sp. KLOTTS4A1]|uniref:hypothetical protein n=1 Tax=Streptomyces sp. KLOTTS4A1 TaxID=3390996 RepID=UPI0039F59FE4